jgi:hypothetical protein
MCGSAAVALQPPEPTAPAGLEGLASLSEARAVELVDSAIEAFRAFTAWVRAQGVDLPCSPETPRNVGPEQWPG